MYPPPSIQPNTANNIYNRQSNLIFMGNNNVGNSVQRRVSPVGYYQEPKGYILNPTRINIQPKRIIQMNQAQIRNQNNRFYNPIYDHSAHQHYLNYPHNQGQHQGFNNDQIHRISQNQALMRNQIQNMQNPTINHPIQVNAQQVSHHHLQQQQQQKYHQQKQQYQQQPNQQNNQQNQQQIQQQQQNQQKQNKLKKKQQQLKKQENEDMEYQQQQYEQKNKNYGKIISKTQEGISSQKQKQKGQMMITPKMDNQFQPDDYENDEQVKKNIEQSYHEEEPNIQNIFWEQKFYTIYERFEWFYERFQMTKNDYNELNQQLKLVYSEEDWIQLKQHHQEFGDKLEDLQQELGSVMGENQQLIDQNVNLESDSVWQHRYHELLGNFKAIEDENAQLKMRISISGGNEDSNQKYNEILQEYHLLEDQYHNVVNQLNMKKDNQKGVYLSQQAQIQNKKQALVEIQKHKQIINKMNSENIEMQHILQQLQKSNQSLVKELEFYEKNKENQERLKQLLTYRDNELFELKSQSNKNSIKYSSQDLVQKDRQIGELKRILVLKQNNIIQLNKSVGKQMEFTRELDYQRRMRKQKQKKIGQLMQQIEKIYTQQQNNTLNRIKMQSFGKKVDVLTQELSKMHNKLNNTDQDYKKLKIIKESSEKQTSTLKNQHNQQLKRIKILEDQLKKKDNLSQNYLNQLQEVKDKNEQTRLKRQSYNDKFHLSTVQELNQQLNKKESQILKYKQLMDIKVNYVEKLQNQLNLQKMKLIECMQLQNRERQQFGIREQQLQNRNLDYDKKMRSLDHQFGISMINNLENQVIQLRKKNLQKQEEIRIFQNEQIEKKGIISCLRKQQTNYQQQKDQMRKKIQELQNSKDDVIRKTQNNFKEIHNRELQIETISQRQVHLKTQIKNYQMQFQQKQQLIQNKNQIITQLHSKINQFIDRINFLQKISKDGEKYEHKKTNNSIEALKQKIKRLQSIQIKQGDIIKQKSLNSLDQEIIHETQGKAIQQLLTQNASLRQQISKILLNQYSPLKESNKKLNYSAQQNADNSIDYIQNRLNNFNHKLDEMIQKNSQLIKIQDIDQTNEGKKNEFKTQKKSLISHYESEIVKLKNELTELRKYCASLDMEEGKKYVPNAHNSLIFAQQQRLFHQQLQFYQEKIKDLNLRNEKMLKLNNQLKERLSGLIKPSSPSTCQYYKLQLSQNQVKCQILIKKLKKLTEENQTLRNQVQEANNKANKVFQSKTFDLQDKIQQLTHSIYLLNMEKSSIQNERVNLLHHLKTYTSDMQIIKSNNDTKDSQYEYNLQDMRRKNNDLQKELKKLEEKIQNLERINNSLSKKLNLIEQANVRRETAQIKAILQQIKKTASHQENIHQINQIVEQVTKRCDALMNKF